MESPVVARVLLAEDDPVSQRVMIALLEVAHCEVRAVESGPLAVQAATSARFDLVILDYHLPGLDACGVARAIASSLGPETPPVVGISASVDDVRELCLNAGMVTVMAKPLQRAALLTLVQKYVPGILESKSVTPAPSETGPSSFDYDALLRQLGGNQGLLRKILDRYAEVTPAYCVALRVALGAADYQALAGAAHMLKGAAASAGAPLVSQAAGALEAMAQVEEPRGLPDLLAHLELKQMEFLQTAAAYQTTYQAGTKSPAL